MDSGTHWFRLGRSCKRALVAWGHFLKTCGGVCYHIRKGLFMSIMWVPLAILFWWAWGWEMVNGPWMEYKSGVPVDKTIVRGKELPVEWEYEIFHDCPRDIELRLIGPVEYLIHSHQGRTTGKGVGKRTLISYVPIPENAPKGEYYLESTSTGHCTPLHSKTYRHDTSSFLVTTK